MDSLNTRYRQSYESASAQHKRFANQNEMKRSSTVNFCAVFKPNNFPCISIGPIVAVKHLYQITFHGQLNADKMNFFVKKKTAGKKISAKMCRRIDVEKF